MFELNLIKDKALQRQRRRIIFLAIMLVVFLSGLLSIFVGGMIWKEHNRIEALIASNNTAKSEIDTKTKELDVEEPKARKRRRGLILAYQESVNVIKKRPRFTKILMDIVNEQPSGEFWYNTLTIDPSDQVSDSEGNPNAAAESLISRNLRLDASGHIRIVDSDIITTRELNAVAKRMKSIEYWMSEPNFIVSEVQKETSSAPGEEALNYRTFTVTASRRAHRGMQE